MTINTLSRKNGKGPSESRIERAKARFQTVKQAAAETARRIAEHIPANAKRGFDDGRQAGNDFVEHGIPYGIGAGIGFGVGVTEGIVGVLATPARLLVGLGCGLVRWCTARPIRGTDPRARRPASN